MPRREIKVEIIGDSSSAQRAFSQVDHAAEGTGSKMSRFGDMLKGALVAAAGAAVIKFGKDSVEAFKESEQAQARLSDAFSKFPALADTNITELEKLNAALARKTRFDDDATASGQAVLAQFGLTGKQIKDLTPLLQDYAARTGKDLPDAAQDLGKALLGQGRALKNVGIDFEDAGSVGANFDQLMGGLRKQVGGFAEKEGKTTSGRLQILQNQFGEVQEQVGAKLVPALSKLANILIKIIGWFDGLNSGVKVAIGVVAGLLAGVFAISKAIQAWTAIQAAFNVVLSANPIGLVIIALAALVAAVVVVIRHWDKVKEVTGAVWDWIWSKVKSVTDFLVGLFLNFHPAGLIIKHWQAIKDTAGAVWDFITGKVSDAVGIISGHVNALVDFVGGLPGRAADAIRGVIGTLADIGRDAFFGFGAIAGDALNGMVGFLSGIPGRAWDVLSGIVGGLAGLARDAFFGFGATAGQALNGMVDFLGGIPGRAWDALRWLGGKIGDVARDAFFGFGAIAGQALNGMIDFLWGIPGRAWDALRSLPDVLLNAVRNALNAVIDVWNRFGLEVDVPGPIGRIKIFDTPNIPHLQEGGVTTRDTLAFLHANEAVVPLPASGVGLGNVTVNVYGSVVAERDLAETVRRELVRVGRSNGSTGL